MELQLREAREAEIPRLVDMKLAMFSESGRGALLDATAKARIVSDYEQMYRENLARHFVAGEGPAIVASVGAFLKSDVPYRYFTPSRYGFIGDVYTEPSHRKRGLAAALSRKALEWLKRQDVLTVRLLASEAGRPIYARLGFKPTDEMVLNLEP